MIVTASEENGEKQTWIAAVARAEVPAQNDGASAPRLEKELLWEQSERILDALFVRGTAGEADRLAILSKEALSIFQKQNGAWKAAFAKLLGEAATAQRAPRGDLSYSPDQPEKLKIVVGGKSCQTTLTENTAIACTPGAEAPRTGMLLASNCDSRVWWLRADAGDATMPDRLELVMPAAPQAQPAIAELPVPGPVLAISSGEALRADTAVVFNLATGNYEVYRIALACGF